MHKGSNHLAHASVPREQVKSVVDEYRAFHAGPVQVRKTHYTEMVNDYYNLVTDFYEFGWGQSFHFAPRWKGESLDASLARHELYLAFKLGLQSDMTVLDVGCGVGGPMRTIARFSGAKVLGVNNNDYQIERATQLNRQAGLAERCCFLKADFMKLPLPDGSCDAVYAIEATCHAPDKLALFRELFRIMKPGAQFAGYEWCLTDQYRADDAEHRAIKKAIELGNGLPDIWFGRDVVDALKAAGFELLSGRDLADDSDSDTPWYLPLTGRPSLSGFKHTATGRWLTNAVVRLLERVRVAPKGSTAVSSFLNAGADALVKGGRNGTFTPVFFFHVRKPTSVP